MPPRCGGGFAAPTFLCPKEKSPRPVEKKFFCFRFWHGAPLVALRLRSARGRSVGGRRGVQFYRQPVPLTPAPIAARPVWGVSSQTTAPSTATLRQQGVAESLFVLGSPMVAAAYNIRRPRAAQDRLPIPSKPPANPTPAFAGRWDPTSHKPRRDFFFHRARRILFDLSKRMGGAFPPQSGEIPRL